MTRKASLQVAPGVAQVQTPQQKKFNTLMQRIAKQRDLLREWEAAIALFHQRHTAEMAPLEQQELHLKAELVKVFDGLSEQKIAKADRAHLQDLICGYVNEVLAVSEDEDVQAQLKAIYSRHAAVDYDTEQVRIELEEDTLGRIMVQQMFGLELGDDELPTPEVLMQKLGEQREKQNAAQSTQEEAAPKRPRSQKTTARERKQQEAAQQLSQSVREIYRKLASSLHPDRETDHAERERKTALMQRVNQAYNAGQLLQLLELQLEIEQIDTNHIAGLSEERLKHYNQVLSEQCQELKQEANELLQTLLMRYQLSPFESYTPKKLGQIFNQDLAYRKDLLQVLSNQLQTFTDEPQRFKRWLKDDRALHREHERQQMDDGFSFFY